MTRILSRIGHNAQHPQSDRLLAEINAHLSERGLFVGKGTIVDATIINAPSSTKNEKKQRDPQMHQTSKGKQWYFGMKVHTGTDADSGQVHTVKGRPDIARWLAGQLLDDGIDVSYAYKPLHMQGLAHAFMNTQLFLDYDRVGFPWPIICMPINCYGSRVISAKGFFTPFGTETELDPPSPSPRRLMEVGGAVARHLRESPWRVAVVASSSWSHAFLTDKTWRLVPDTASDRAHYEALVAGDYAYWESTTTAAIEDAGQQELLNWFALFGAVRELGLGRPVEHTFVETHCFNSNKVFARWEVAS